MKFFVTARFGDKEKVKEINNLIESKGHELTSDWVDRAPLKSPFDSDPSLSQKYSVEDIDAVINADVFVLITNEQAGIGSSTELGAALALNVRLNKPKVYVVGDHLGNHAFNFHPSVVHKKTIEEVLEETS